jgi:hypothetical protein
MTPHYEYRTDRRPYYEDREESLGAVAAVVVVVVLSALSYVLVVRFHFRPAQLVELSLYALCSAAAVCTVIWYSLTLRKRREANWPHPPLFITQTKDRTAVKSAFEQNAIVLGYDVHGKPWLWPDATRIMQAVVCGATGSGKTTLLRNIITQDLFRTWGPPDRPRQMPMLIVDC